ncbi:MAG: VPLPA-CTERM sorting domain-containing protein [Rhodobacteraceae bacterium]|nr:VPLPA-CTERM sorting domain-containing protein [Paracoccaceae bacterium]
MTIRSLAIAAALVALTATSGLAATVQLNVVGGQLIGARNVDVNGTFYDVEFVDGTCAIVFNGCDSVSDFEFSTLDLAEAAAVSLGDTVFVDGPLGDFDSDPTLTVGIDTFAGSGRGTITVPYDFTSEFGIERIVARSFVNRETSDLLSFSLVPIGADLSDDDTWTFARFTPSQLTPVPLPAGGFLLLAGLAGLGALRAWRNKDTAH